MSDLFNKREDIEALSPEDAIANSVDFGMFNLRYDPVLERNSVPQSTVSKSVELGEQITRVAVKDTKSAKGAQDAELEPQSPQSIATADYISSTSYKKDAKLVIRVIPTASLGVAKDGKAKLREDIDPRLSFDRFSLQAVSENDDERYQLHETFDSATLFLFGRRPRIWTYQGIVLNGRRPLVPAALTGDENKALREVFLQRFNMDFANELLRRYDRFYRGTKAVEQRARTYIVYDDVIVEGTMLNMIAVRNSSVPGAVNVAFTVVVHDRAFIGTSLLDTGEQTLSALIKGKVRDVPVSRILAPTMAPPRDTLEQLERRVAESQETVEKAQVTAEVATASVSAIDASLKAEQEAVEDADAAAAAAFQAFAVAEDAGDANAAAIASAAATIAAERRDSSLARIQSLNASRDTAATDLKTAEQTLEIAEGTRGVLEVEATNNSNADRFECPPGFRRGLVLAVDETSVNSSGQKTRTITVFPGEGPGDKAIWKSYGPEVNVEFIEEDDDREIGVTQTFAIGCVEDL